MNENNFKYDVAFSFLAEDEELVIQINNLIQDRIVTFLYSRKQGEIAGTDGEQAFNRVFGSEARIVFVLYRENWGKTPWTRIEETAIRNRAFDEGYDFVLFALINKSAKVPDWLPKNRIWIGLERWGIEGAASVIESRVQESGGNPKDERVEDRAVRLSKEISFEKKKQAFFKTKEAVEVANKEIEQLFSELKRITDNLNNSENSINLKLKATANQCAIYGDGFTLFFHWSLSYANTLGDSAFYISLWKGLIALSGSSFMHEEKPRKLQEIKFSFDQTIAEKPVWREVFGQKRSLSTDRVMDIAMTMLLDKIREVELRKH